MGSVQPAPSCRGCGTAGLRRTNKSGPCGRCRPKATCGICRFACGRGNPCPDCVAVGENIAAVHRTDFDCRPPSGQLSARLAYYESRARAGLDLFPAPDPLPLASLPEVPPPPVAWPGVLACIARADRVQWK
jgi:hypothetical protein